MKVRLIRKEELRSYFLPVIIYGPILGLIIFLVMRVDNTMQISAIKGFSLGIVIIFGLQLLGFIIMEIFVRGNQIKKLQKENFKILEQCGIQLCDDLVFRGNYKGYWIHIYPYEVIAKKRKQLNFTIISYYNYPDTLVDESSKLNYDQENGKTYDIGTINFNKNIVSLVPTDGDNPDFKSLIDFLIYKLQELELTPFDFKT